MGDSHAGPDAALRKPHADDRTTRMSMPGPAKLKAAGRGQRSGLLDRPERRWLRGMPHRASDRRGTKALLAAPVSRPKPPRIGTPAWCSNSRSSSAGNRSASRTLASSCASAPRRCRWKPGILRSLPPKSGNCAMNGKHSTSSTRGSPSPCGNASMRRAKRPTRRRPGVLRSRRRNESRRASSARRSSMRLQRRRRRCWANPTTGARSTLAARHR